MATIGNIIIKFNIFSFSAGGGGGKFVVSVGGALEQGSFVFCLHSVCVLI